MPWFITQIDHRVRVPRMRDRVQCDVYLLLRLSPTKRTRLLCTSLVGFSVPPGIIFCRCHRLVLALFAFRTGVCG